MCIKTYKLSSSSFVSKKTTALNPSAQEWRPNPHATNPPLLQPYQFLPHPPPPPPPFAAAPPFHRASFSFSAYQDFTLSGPCKQPRQPVYNHSAVDFPPPETPVPGGGAGVKKGPKTLPVGAERRKFVPPRFRRAMLSFSVEKKPKGSRLKWRPRNSGAAAASSPPAAVDLSPSLKTTVMIKNIPNHLRRDFMLKFLDSYCKAYSLEYDFMYLPMDFRYLDNLGYAFVNFTSGDAAQKFKEVLQGYKWNTFQTDGGKLLSSKKICDITWARIQGKEGLVKRFQNSTFACDKPGFLPVMLDPPRNGSDPNPAPPLVVGRIWRRDISKTH